MFGDQGLKNSSTIDQVGRNAIDHRIILFIHLFFHTSLKNNCMGKLTLKLLAYNYLQIEDFRQIF